jgi:integrase
LRHTAVSLWIADGASPIDVQHMVGHTDVQTTLAQYAHLFSWGGEALAASMERRLEAHRNGGAESP